MVMGHPRVRALLRRTAVAGSLTAPGTFAAAAAGAIRSPPRNKMEELLSTTRERSCHRRSACHWVRHRLSGRRAASPWDAGRPWRPFAQGPALSYVPCPPPLADWRPPRAAAHVRRGRLLAAQGVLFSSTGVRQGDPLGPVLFALAAARATLTRAIKEAAADALVPDVHIYLTTRASITPPPALRRRSATPTSCTPSSAPPLRASESRAPRSRRSAATTPAPGSASPGSSSMGHEDHRHPLRIAGVP